jgi:hypothetical protein
MTHWISAAFVSAEWKWEKIGMDFIMGLLSAQSGYNSIWAIVDQLTKVAYFIHIKTTYFGPQLAELYMSKIVCLHGVPKKNVSDRGTQFTSRFWQRLHETLNTQLCFSFFIILRLMVRLRDLIKF